MAVQREIASEGESRKNVDVLMVDGRQREVPSTYFICFGELPTRDSQDKTVDLHDNCGPSETLESPMLCLRYCGSSWCRCM